MLGARAVFALLAALLLPGRAARRRGGRRRQPLGLVGVPFAGMLLSIALLPLLAPRVWHHHFGKIAAAWALAFLLPCALSSAPAPTGAALVHTLVAEYIPFIMLLVALFTAAGGIYVRGNLHGSPALNVAILASARCWRASWARPARRCC